MQEILDRCAPEKIVKRTENHKTYGSIAPYANSETSWKQRNWKKYKQQHHWKAYTMQQNRYIWLLHYFKKQSINKTVLDCKKDTKELFCLVNRLTGNTTQIPLPSNKTNEELAEDFAKFFLSRIENIREKVINMLAYKPAQLDTPKFVSFCPSTEMEVCTVIMNMKNKHCELDTILTSTLKQILEACLPIITQIVSLSQTTGEFCEEWKTAIVKPLLKPGLEITNKIYRPISNLPFISKLVAKCMFKHLLDHCKNHNLLLDFQSAYCEHYSTETSFIKLTNGILWLMERHQMTAIAILDLLAAFDMVDHEILLEILEQHFGFCGKAQHWFQNYLRPW